MYIDFSLRVRRYGRERLEGKVVDGRFDDRNKG
jgi:hypothetical protein